MFLRSKHKPGAEEILHAASENFASQKWMVTTRRVDGEWETSIIPQHRIANDDTWKKEIKRKLKIKGEKNAK